MKVKKNKMKTNVFAAAAAAVAAAGAAWPSVPQAAQPELMASLVNDSN